jgi:hypothetical protein
MAIPARQVDDADGTIRVTQKRGSLDEQAIPQLPNRIQPNIFLTGYGGGGWAKERWSAMEVGVRQSSVGDACIDSERFSGGVGNLEHIPRASAVRAID